MKSQALHTMWCNISGEAAGEIWCWSPLVSVHADRPSVVLKVCSPIRSRSTWTPGRAWSAPRPCCRVLETAALAAAREPGGASENARSATCWTETATVATNSTSIGFPAPSPAAQVTSIGTTEARFTRVNQAQALIRATWVDVILAKITSITISSNLLGRLGCIVCNRTVVIGLTEPFKHLIWIQIT